MSRSRASSLLRALALALVILGLLPAAHAGPWVPSPGKVYVELSEQLSTTARGFDAAGHLRPLATVADDGSLTATRLYDASTRLYGEVGLATRLALVVDLKMLGVVATPRAGQRAREGIGVGDLVAGFRLQLLDEEVTCALDARLGIPTGNADAAQPLGTGDLRGEVSLSVGRAWERVPIFLVVEVGARLRSSGTQRAQAAGRDAALVDPLQPTAALARVTIDYASEILYAVELGYVARLGERWRLTPRLTLDGRHGFSAPTPLPIDPIAPASVRLLRLGASLGLGTRLGGRSLARVELRLGGGAFVWGEGLPAAGEVSLALGFSR